MTSRSAKAVLREEYEEGKGTCGKLIDGFEAGAEKHPSCVRCSPIMACCNCRLSLWPSCEMRFPRGNTVSHPNHVPHKSHHFLPSSGLRNLDGKYLYIARKKRRVTYCQSQQSNVDQARTLSPDRKLKQLRSQLKEAVKLEDYQKAAEVRDKIQELEDADPILQLEAQLKAAIENENFEEAVRCRDELFRLRPERKKGPPLTPPPPTLSDTVTNGIRVQVKSSFLPYRSRPGQFVFMYRVRIVNEAAKGPVKLHRRHWIVTDANSYQDQIRGDGVLGEQPELALGQEHIYSSYVPIRTPTGKMVGSYQMQVKDDTGDWQDSFKATVGVFGLDMSDATPAKW